MTDIEKQALALVNAEIDRDPTSNGSPEYAALCRAIEQHEAFKLEVSDAVEAYMADPQSVTGPATMRHIHRLIIAKPDHVQDALEEVFAGDSLHIDCAKELREALAARGLEIREVGHD